jgi:c-di-GMP-binding flagellar brake protein YcgR
MGEPWYQFKTLFFLFLVPPMQIKSKIGIAEALCTQHIVAELLLFACGQRSQAGVWQARTASGGLPDTTNTDAMTMSSEQGEQKLQEFEFEAMNLQVGGRLQFITHRSIKPVQHFSTLIGFIKDEYMIVKIPTENGAPISLTEGEKLTIRVFSGVTVCSFSCTVERVFGRPLLYVHISFPKSIQGTSLRAAMRVKVDIAAKITGPRPGSAPVNCALVNLSVTGALVESPRKLPPDDEMVTLEFPLIAQPGNYQVNVNTRATIKNVNVVKPSSDNEMFTYGVQFVDLDLAHYALLQNLTYEALIADRQKIV